jgi:SAM-dependent methyltransferase
MSDLARRLARLSPRQRELLKRLAGQRSAVSGGEVGPGPAAGLDPSAGVDIAGFYDSVSRQLDSGPFAEQSRFLNYGYVPNDAPSFAPVRPPPGSVNRSSIRLVLELIGDLPLRPDQALLDVGCGRGGTVWVLRELFEVGPIAALDLSGVAAASCRRRSRWDRTEFLCGDAQALPFAPASFDVVTNVESSHCYADLDAFFGEVGRVLRPGGAFLYTDLLETAQISEIEERLARCGFRQERRRDITGNVLLSCAETAGAKARAFSAGNDSDLMGSFLGAVDSPTYETMKVGIRRYMMYRLVSESP